MTQTYHPPPPSYHKPEWELISQGAEARVWLIQSFLTCSSKSTNAICKERFPRSYRHPDLDASILKSRLRSEARSLVRCRRGGVKCPAVYAVDEHTDSGSMCLFLEYIQGITVREFLQQRAHLLHSSESNDLSSDSDQDETTTSSPPRKKIKEDIDTASLKVVRAIGALVAKMHNTNIVHGDLTTSNIMLTNATPSSTDWEPELVLIDFGLAGTAGAKGVSHEEKAVDLYVLERAFEATHPYHTQLLVQEIVAAYKALSNTSDSVLQRLAQVRLRGRKRECFG